MHVCLLRIRLVPQRITSLHEPDSEIIYFLVKLYRRTDGETQHALCIKKITLSVIYLITVNFQENTYDNFSFNNVLIRFLHT